MLNKSTIFTNIHNKNSVKSKSSHISYTQTTILNPMREKVSKVKLKKSNSFKWELHTKLDLKSLCHETLIQ